MSAVIILVVLLLVLGVGAGGLLFWAVSTFNRLVRRRNQVQAASAQIGVQVRRRHDLIPGLVATVTRYAAHEKGTLDAVVRARAAAVAADDAAPAVRARAEGELTAVLGRLLAVTEAYPDLKANENFVALQHELAATEDKIAYARQFFNNAVQTMNTTVQSVPGNVIAALGRFHTEQYVEATGAQRGGAAVRF